MAVGLRAALVAAASVAVAVLLLGPAPTESGCGQCWCAPGNGTCPTWHPPTYNKSLVVALRSQQPVNPFDLTCNPYANKSACSVVPPQQYVDSPTAVCGRLYEPGNCTEDGPTMYKMVSFPNASAALAAGALITHERACGVCSTTQDISVYIAIQDMTKVGKKCAIEAAVSEKWGIKCFQKLGFTLPCARIWTYDALYDAKHCAGICLKEIFKPYNGPPPFCAINACLECDETVAGPIFKSYAGATRRRCGLLSTIVRPCPTVAKLFHRACP